MRRDHRDPGGLCIVIGRNRIGKTTALRHLLKVLPQPQPGLVVDPEIIGIGPCLRKCVAEDTGQLHHRRYGPGEQDFEITDPVLPKAAISRFLQLLGEPIPTGTIRFADWAEGVNSLPHEDPRHLIDYSCKTMREKIERGELPSAWIGNASRVLHIEATDAVRQMLFNGQPLATAKPAIALLFFDVDDFRQEFEPLLSSRGIPCHHIVNDGTTAFFSELVRVAREIPLQPGPGIASAESVPCPGDGRRPPARSEPAL